MTRDGSTHWETGLVLTCRVRRPPGSCSIIVKAGDSTKDSLGKLCYWTTLLSGVEWKRGCRKPAAFWALLRHNGVGE